MLYYIYYILYYIICWTFIISACSCAIFLMSVAKFFCGIKSLFSIHLKFQMNNLKLNSVVCFDAFYGLTSKLIIALFIISNIKITSLKIWLVCLSFNLPCTSLLMPEQSRVRLTLLFLLANSVKSLLIQINTFPVKFVSYL